MLEGPLGDRLRRAYWRRHLGFLGDNVRISAGAFFQGSRYVRLDDACWIDRNVFILAGPAGGERVTTVKENPDFPLQAGDVYIGKRTHIGPGCVVSGIGGVYIGMNSGVAANSAIYSFSHHYRNAKDPNDKGQYSFTPCARPDQQSMISGAVYIGDYTAVGLCSVLLPGTSLGRGSWVASGSVVQGRFPEMILLRETVETTTKSLEGLTIIE